MGRQYVRTHVCNRCCSLWGSCHRFSSWPLPIPSSPPLVLACIKCLIVIVFACAGACPADLEKSPLCVLIAPMYVCIHACTCARGACTHTRMHVCIHARMCTYIHIHVYISISVYIYIYYIHIYISYINIYMSYISTYMNVCMHARMCACMHVHVWEHVLHARTRARTDPTMRGYLDRTQTHA